jgi:peroxiredoxin
LRLSAALVVLCALALLAGCESGPKGPLVRIGSALPPLTFTDASGAPVVLPASLAGKVAVVLFWQKGCHYCEREMPSIEPLFLKYEPEGFVYVGVHMGDDPGAVRSMVEANGLTFPMLVDAGSAARLAYGVGAVPTMFLLDREGIVREKILGGLGGEALERLVVGHLRAGAPE